jgi:hypothetical protein
MGGEYLNTRQVFLLPPKEYLVIIGGYLVMVMILLDVLVLPYFS